MPQDPSGQLGTASAKSQCPVRRRFSEGEKLRILEGADRCARRAEMGLVLRTEGILNAVELRAPNAAAESMIAPIQRIKATACGFSHCDCFRTAILLHPGALALGQRSASAQRDF